MNHSFPSNIMVTESSDSITFFDENFKHFQARKDHPRFDEIISALVAGDVKSAVELSKPMIAVAAALTVALSGDDTDESAKARWFRRQAGKVIISDFGVSLQSADGTLTPLHGYVIDQLIRFNEEGIDTSSLLQFIVKLYQNPSSVARQELFGWLENADMPITTDGDFIAYKRVRGTYRDIHSNTLTYSVGRVVEMSRLDVDDDRNRTCSAGLHFCSRSYLPNFSSNAGTDRIMLVKINPADVVSIPADYNDSKGRSWRMEVVGETTLEEAGVPWVESVWGDDYSPWEDEDEYDENDDDEEVDDDDDAEIDFDEQDDNSGYFTANDESGV